MPAGTPGGVLRRVDYIPENDARAFANNLFRTPDRVRKRVGDMVLVHGGDSKGRRPVRSSWAEPKKIKQVVFGLDSRLGQKAGFRRNEQFLGIKPRYFIAYPGNGVRERLVIEGKQRRISVVDRRGPLGTPPAEAALKAA